MAPNKALIYNSVPRGVPVAGQDLTIETLTFDPSAAPPPGGVTTKNYYASFDPSQRGRMRDPKIQSYSPPMVPGTPVQSVAVIAKVLKSDTPAFQVGDWIRVGYGSTEEYSVVEGSRIKRNEGRDVTKIQNPKGLPLSTFLGALGMTGLTAYGGYKEIGSPKKGETIFVSAGAGAVGQLVGQFALREGLNVIGSVGDDRKLEFITKELGFTHGFNYKKEKTSEALARLAPDGIDIFFDNVGGETLDDAIVALKVFGRIVACGSISQYNVIPGQQYGVKNTGMMVRKRLRWQGMLVSDPNIAQHADEWIHNVTSWLSEGSLVQKEHVTEGIDNAADGFLGMLDGKNLGKSILRIAKED